MQDDKRRAQLADFLKTRRARIQPEEVGLPSGTRRRTPGLRREEVALLAGIGVDWYTWLEQGRDIRVSEDVLDSLARTLHLSEAERRHLFLLAHQQLPPIETAPARSTVSPAIQSFVDLQGDVPTYVIDYKWDVVAWNRSAEVLFGDFTTFECHNVALLVFVAERFRTMLDDWEGHAQRVVALYRQSYGKYLGDPAFEQNIAHLQDVSPEFAEWWDDHDIMGRKDYEKVMHHPAVGNLYFNQITMSLTDAPEMLMVVNIPLEDTDTREKIQQLVDYVYS